MRFLIIIFILLNCCILYSCSSLSSKQTNNNFEIINNTDFNNDSILIGNDISVSTEYLLGKFNSESNDILVKVPEKYCLIRKEYIHKDVLNPFIEMYEVALKEGIELKIVSAYRTFDVQKWLWEQKYYSSINPKEVVKQILEYIAMPGTSRHHWGTDVDILSTSPNYYESAKGKIVYEWLQNNASKFGFYQIYTADNDRGYNEEKWHWSYISIANKYQKLYKERITYNDFKGFYGCEFAEELNIIENYVLNIYLN